MSECVCAHTRGECVRAHARERACELSERERERVIVKITDKQRSRSLLEALFFMLFQRSV